VQDAPKDAVPTVEQQPRALGFKKYCDGNNLCIRNANTRLAGEIQTVADFRSRFKLMLINPLLPFDYSDLFI